MGKLEGKVAVITGASSGIGKAIAKKFAANGSQVVLCARSRDALEQVKKEITASGGIAECFAADVAMRRQVDALMEFAVERFGKIDILVNSAGYGLYKRFIDSSTEEIDNQIAVNINGICNTTYATLKHMLPNGGGRFINLGSIASLRPCANFVMYTTVKHAVYGFSRAIYEEYRTQGIKVNILCPAYVMTNFYEAAGIQALPYPPADQIQAEDIAEAAYYCAAAPDNVNVENIVMWPVCQDTLYR